MKLLYTITLLFGLLIVFSCTELLLGEWNNPVDPLRDDSEPPGEVRNLKCESGDKELYLSWIDPDDVDFDHVEIWYGIDSANNQFIGNIKNLSTTITGLENFTVYHIKVLTIDSIGNFSEGILINKSTIDTFLSPINGAYVSNRPLLDFPSSLEDNKQYDVEISLNNDISLAFETATGLSKSQYQVITPITSGITYYWRYRVTGGEWSNIMSYEFIPHNIGDNAGGGIVFYIDTNNEYNWNYLIAAPSDLSTGIKSFDGGNYIETVNTGTAIGTGLTNTIAIISGHEAGYYVAKLCNEYDFNGYDDWFLPSKDELNQMYTYRQLIGGFTLTNYWTSSQYDISIWVQDFNVGYQNSVDCTADPSYAVRAIRFF